MKSWLVVGLVLLLSQVSYSQQQSKIIDFLDSKTTSGVLVATSVATTILDVERSYNRIKDSNGTICEANFLFKDGCQINRKKNYLVSFSLLGATIPLEMKFPKIRKYLNALRLGITSGHTIGVIFTF